jgi:hypothetical protein
MPLCKGHKAPDGIDGVSANAKMIPYEVMSTWPLAPDTKRRERRCRSFEGVAEKAWRGHVKLTLQDYGIHLLYGRS